MKLPTTAHTERGWRVHEIAPDFLLEDVWALPTPGGPDELHRLVRQFAEMSFPEGAPAIVRFLWATRWKLGALLKLDQPETGLQARVSSLRDRLPADLHEAPGPELDADHPFTSVYELHDEYVAELANKTMHGLIHLGWVPDGSGRYRGQLAVLVKVNGRFGRAYMAFIKPFRSLLIYPALLRTMERTWNGSTPTDV